MCEPECSEHSETTTFHLPPKPEGRFNNWGKREWIKSTPEWTKFVDRELARLKLMPRARSLCQSAMLTYSRGVEFVFFSNAHLPGAIRFNSGVCIVPCFVPIDIARRFPGDARAMAMSKRGLFVYDGWVPNENWTKAKMEQIVSILDDIVHLFSLSGKYYAHWEPKYPFEKPPIEFHQVSIAELESLSKTIGVVEQLPPSDRVAISRSAAWMADAMGSESPVQRFLLLFVSIEALATYIERESNKDSHLQTFAAEKLSKTERRERREACIQEVLACDFDSDAVKAIRTAYFKCVVGTRRMLEEHLNRVFGNEKASTIMFKEEVEGKTLWQLRNDIAHGNLNIMSEVQIQFLTRQVTSLENIARNYLRKILTHIAGIEYFPHVRRPGLILPASQGIGTPGTEYMGPADMAEYYAGIEVLSSSFVRVNFG